MALGVLVLNADKIQLLQPAMVALPEGPRPFPAASDDLRSLAHRHVGRAVCPPLI